MDQESFHKDKCISGQLYGIQQSEEMGKDDFFYHFVEF